ncbi:MAG: GTP 3',8-cyclase MoaA [Candidatus Brockarchaeota archaeon]|nr:GTP 3',8-cyclase MoaA [Candidatus Brockarchaeota archaeon]
MLDRFGRPVTGLRISVTQKCNLNCFFCHGEWDNSVNREMQREEIKKIIEIGKKFGVNEVKFTGGEPLMRPDIVEIVRDASSIVSEVSLTTNGTLLRDFASNLRDAGLMRLNVNLPSLVPEKYEMITGFRMIDQVLDGIEAAIKAGLESVKINMVLLRGINEHEVPSMIDYALSAGVDLQLIELQPIPSGDEIFAKYHIGIENIQSIISKSVRKISQVSERRDRYIVESKGNFIYVYIVKPICNPNFCAECRRLRVTSDGRLKPCLLRNDNLIDFVKYIRDNDQKELSEKFLKAIELREPYWKWYNEDKS